MNKKGEISEAWYINLIDDLKDIAVETEFTSRWALVEGRHQLGSRILQEYENFQRLRMPDSELVQRIAFSIQRHTRTVYYAIQFARMFPDLNKLPEGKNCNWHKIINKYLLLEGDKPKRPTVASLMNIIGEIKKLLETERLIAFQEGQTSKVEFIRYLQDQIEKIVNA